MNLPRNSCSWKIAGTKFLRHSSTMILDHYGMNLQNPSENVCRIHIPDDGKIFVQVDQAGAEALIVAYLTPHKRFRELFLQGIKPHIYVAMHIFKELWEREGHPANFFCTLPIEEISKQPQWKQFAKVIKSHAVRYFLGKKTVHAGNYREGAKTMQTSIVTETEGKVNLPIKECERFLILYREILFPEIPFNWWPEVEHDLRKYKVLYNLQGFPIRFTSIINDKVIREATACVPQSTVGTITNMAFSELQDYIDNNQNCGIDILNNKHDAILVQCNIGTELATASLVKDALEKDLLSPRGEKFKMKTEIQIGMNWGKFDEELNPNGLKEVVI